MQAVGYSKDPEAHLDPDEGLDDDMEQEREARAYENEFETGGTWNELVEDETGNLRVVRNKQESKSARRKSVLSEAQGRRVRRGMIRYLQLLVDMSEAMLETDFRPSRLARIVDSTSAFIKDFFQQNHLSQLGVATLASGVANTLTELSGSPERHVAKLMSAASARGAASLQNGLVAGLGPLRAAPPYGQREVLVIFGALTTCDPGNIHETIQQLKDAHVRVSVIGLAAEVYVCKKVCVETGGTYHVALNEAHFDELLLAHSQPPPTRADEAAAKLVRMGFPSRGLRRGGAVVFVGDDATKRDAWYTCPACGAHVLDLPTTCPRCQLTLVSSQQLARSYHHLFPVPPYTEHKLEDVAARAAGCTLNGAGGSEGLLYEGEGLYCYSCLIPLDGSGDGDGLYADEAYVYSCETCQHLFCGDCDLYVHETLHNCPGCELGQGLPPDDHVGNQ